MLTAAGIPTTTASWNSAASTSGPTLTSKKVFPTTVDSYFLDWYDAYNGTPSSRKVSAIMYPDANNTTNADPLPTTFSTSYYEQFNYLGPDLPAGQVLSNVYWHFSFASNTGGDSTCFYVATWKISNNTLIANHGSAASPIGCQSSTVAQYDVALPEITNTDQVKDFLGLRVYGKNAGNYIKIDGNWLSGSLMYNNGTQSYANFTVLNSDRYSVEPGNPSPPSQASWGLAKYNDGTSGSSYVVSTGGNLPASATSSFDTTKYLEFDQPSSPWIDPVPTGATITASSITISYNAATGSGANMCLEALVYVSGSLVSSGVSGGAGCSTGNASNSQYTINTTGVISTPAQAGNVYLRVTANNTGTLAKVAVDNVKLSVTYSLT